MPPLQKGVMADLDRDAIRTVMRKMSKTTTMSAAGLAATGVSFLLTNNVTLRQIMLILIVGLLIDILTTWIGNVAFLRFYLERKNVKN